jgi:hypothetical protein
MSYLEKGYIVVVAGFQGASEDGEIRLFGRGGAIPQRYFGGTLKRNYVVFLPMLLE